MSSSKIRIVSLLITDFEQFRAQIVDEYKSASKLISDAIGRVSEKKTGILTTIKHLAFGPKSSIPGVWRSPVGEVVCVESDFWGRTYQNPSP